MNDINDAIRIALNAHKNQVDKQGVPYILHVLRVGLSGETREENIVGFLHDLLEDTSFPEELLKDFFSEDIISAIKILTKQSHVSYEEYINSIVDSNNMLACSVKLNDLRDNYYRLNEIKDPDIYFRLSKKYINAINLVQNFLEREY